MAKGYWVASIDVADPEKYKEYVAANQVAFKKYGARYLIRAGKFENPEGTSLSRNVVIEFDSYQQALDCYHSPEYQHAISIRKPIAKGNIVIIEGYEGAQPG